MDTSVESLQYLPSLPHISPVTPLKFNQGLPGVTEDHKAVRKASDYPPPASTVWPSRGENRLHQPTSCRGMTSTFSPRTAEWLLSCCDPTTRYERNKNDQQTQQLLLLSSYSKDNRRNMWSTSNSVHRKGDTHSSEHHLILDLQPQLMLVVIRET